LLDDYIVVVVDVAVADVAVADVVVADDVDAGGACSRPWLSCVEAYSLVDGLEVAAAVAVHGDSVGPS